MSAFVDVDSHVDVTLEDLVRYIDQPWRREVEFKQTTSSLLPGSLGAPDDLTQSLYEQCVRDEGASGHEPDFVIVFPSRLSSFTFHPRVRLEAAIAMGYARWLTQAFLPAHPRMRAMLYLPIRDVDSSCRLINEFGDAPGILGAFVTNLVDRYPFDNEHMRLYALLEDRELPLGFHPILLWTEPQFKAFDSYMGAYAYGYPFIQSGHLMNWILNGMPERFPRLSCVYYGSGVAWLNFAAHRLDQEFMRRPSEAPLLRERPSHYIRRCFYGTHPLEATDKNGYLESTFRLIGCTQFFYASNFPQWDFDSPTVIRGLSFLSPAEQTLILGTNAAEFFHLA